MKNFKFKHFETALTAFISSFENEVNNISENDIPVYILETGDETFLFNKKFETKKFETKEIYNVVPRITLGIEEVSLNSEQDSNQYTKIIYNIDNKNFQSQSRRKATVFPFSCNFVVSNFIKGLEYFEMLLTILSIDNVFTYEYLGNTYQGSYSSQSITFEKTPMENGGTKNFVIKATIDVNLQPMILKIKSIKEIDYNESKKIQIELITKNNDLTRIDTLKNYE